MASALANRGYDPERGDGFSLGDVRSTYITGTFIERDKYIDEITDPFGNTERVERTVYKRMAFRISTSWPQLELYDAPRTFAPFLTTLSQQVQWLSSSSVNTPPLKWLSSLDLPPASLLVEGAVINNIQLSLNVSGKLILSGDKDVIEQFNLVKGRSYLVHGITLRVKDGDKIRRLEIFSDARMKVQQGDFESLLPVARRAVQLLKPD